MSNANPLVSIIVPTFNRAAQISLFVKSVARQGYENIELIIVDDGSQDETKKVIEACAKENPNLIIRLISQKHGGMTRARNNGFLNSRGDYCWFLDSDMELPIGKEVEECIRKCVDEHFDALMIPERSQGKGFWARCRGFEKIINDDDLNKNAVRFIRREVLDQVGLYDPNLTAAEDFEFHNRVKKAGFRFALIKNIFIYHHEVDSIKKMIKKAFGYGKTMSLYIKKRPKEAFEQFFIIRPAYFKNWKLFIKDPISGFGLLTMKFVQYSAAAAGIIVYLGRKIPRPQKIKSSN
ncbi:MAG TPA: glycosyltransferase [Candidatus Methylomirabilis sp.]|nr:glycosyltransferase [Candidatus Methylomirabilis sp.]